MYRSLAVGALTLAGLWQSAWAEDEKVMGSVHIRAGQTVGDATTVNGSVDIDDHATVTRAETVNGHVTLGEQVSAGSVETVNGAVRLGRQTHVTKGVETVNGSVTLDEGADVGGRVTNVNGAIRLTRAHIGGGIETTTGGIDIGADSRVDGGMLVNHGEDGWLSWFGIFFGHRSSEIPRVVIGPRAVVKGDLRFMREVKLYVSDSASVGAVKGANIIHFSGDQPPD